MWEVNSIMWTGTIICWGLILGAIFYTYVKQHDKLTPLRIIITFLVGLISFSINFPFGGETLKIAILPLGVWLLYAVLRHKDWARYRKYAWIGFFSNYLFLISSFVTVPLHALVFAQDEPSTYVAELSEASIFVTHSAEDGHVTLEPNALAVIAQAKVAQMESDTWYNETALAEQGQKRERFPYLLVGTHAKKGSGYTPSVYLERDGFGLLVITDKQHIYFQTEQPIFREEEMK